MQGAYQTTRELIHEIGRVDSASKKCRYSHSRKKEDKLGDSLLRDAIVSSVAESKRHTDAHGIKPDVVEQMSGFTLVRYRYKGGREDFGMVDTREGCNVLVGVAEDPYEARRLSYMGPNPLATKEAMRRHISNSRDAFEARPPMSLRGQMANLATMKRLAESARSFFREVAVYKQESKFAHSTRHPQGAPWRAACGTMLFTVVIESAVLRGCTAVYATIRDCNNLRVVSGFDHESISQLACYWAESMLI